jgi:starch synthase
MLPRPEVIQLLSASTVFVCPSIYEPFGIVNVEAMGTGTSVVASAVGGIKEVVVDGETGALVSYEGDEQGNPLNPSQFAKDFAEQVNRIATDQKLAEQYGISGRKRAVEKFSWKQVAEQTVDLYREVLGS